MWRGFTLLILSTFNLGNAIITQAFPLSKSSWNTGKSMLKDRNELTAVVRDGRIYSMEGEDIASGGEQKDIV